MVYDHIKGNNNNNNIIGTQEWRHSSNGSLGRTLPQTSILMHIGDLQKIR